MMTSFNNKISPEISDIKQNHLDEKLSLNMQMPQVKELHTDNIGAFQDENDTIMEDNTDRQDDSTLSSIKTPWEGNTPRQLSLRNDISKSKPLNLGVRTSIIQDVSRNSSISKSSTAEIKKNRRRSRYKKVSKTKSIASLSAKNSTRTHSSAFELKMAALEEQLQDAAPTNEAIDDINLELKALEDNLIDIDSSDSQSFISGSVVTDNKVPIQTNVLTTKKSKENISLTLLLKENARLRKIVDKLEFELNQSNAKTKISEEPGPEIREKTAEDVPLIYTTLKTKLVESQETILKQKEVLEEQDMKIQELERKVNNLSDTLVMDELYKTQFSVKLDEDNEIDMQPNRVRDSLLMIDDNMDFTKVNLINDTDLNTKLSHVSNHRLQDDVKNFVTQLFAHSRDKSCNSIRQVDQSVSSSMHEDDLSFTLPIYSLYADEPITPILTHSKSFAIGRNSRSPAQDYLKFKSSSKKIMQHLSVPTNPHNKELERDKKNLQKIINELNESNKTLSTENHNQKTQLDANEFTINQMKKVNQQTVSSLMEQVERLKMEVNSYQFQLQDITRKNSALTFELEEANNRIITLEEKKGGFLCF
ncbi:hypothetical protein K502DRAFT_341118 [Neoconidiobolus thromboides FSU 785]|nr:hypothetical protein K502DRAFT_341118 [Neoconidiobolus thromboides FSU 785]